ncbi:MAG: AmmeMemoRadiSam system protein B [Thiotrichales bacterium]
MVEGIWTLQKRVRPAAVAGKFYPGEADALRTMLRGLIDQAVTDAPPPKAMIVPHAGYIYSGPVAASAYARLLNRTQPITRVVLLGPDHRVGFRGMAIPTVDDFATPLGRVALDRDAIEHVARLPGVIAFDQGHAQEHSLEVHLPFLQRVLDGFSLVPIVVGDAPAEQVAAVLDALWGGSETLIVVSSDLSHDHDYATAQRRDRATTEAITQLRGERLSGEDACGYRAIRGLLLTAAARGMTVTVVDQRNSGDTAGSRDRVVGYGAYVLQ